MEGDGSDKSGETENVDGERRGDGGSEENSDESSDGVYDFKDNKTNGTVTVTKEWNDRRTNEGRPEPEIKISAKKPSKSALGYTVTFHGNEDAGLTFADGSYINEVVYNSNGNAVSGSFNFIFVLPYFCFIFFTLSLLLFRYYFCFIFALFLLYFCFVLFLFLAHFCFIFLCFISLFLLYFLSQLYFYYLF